MGHETQKTKAGGQNTMTNALYHEEIGGGYTMQRHITIDAADFRDTCGHIEVMALTDDGDELDTATVTDEAAALVEFNKMVQKYAGPLQKAMNAAELKPGHKYTLVYLSEFGFPVSQKITFDSMSLTTYAQHSDVVKLIFTPFRKRSKYSNLFYNCSLMIFDGWQDMDENAISETLKDDGKIKVTKSKYTCFSASYIEDLEKIFTNPVMIYKDYKRGVNGKLYA